MAQNYYQKEIETMSAEEMRKLQSEKLVKQVKHVYENVAYYRNLMDEKGVKPEDIKGIEDLHKLPFLTKADLRDAYPYGLLAKPLSDCVRIQSTSGTTGRRVVAFYTQKDIDLMMIANAKDFEELEDAMSKITNISMPTVLENESFIEYRQRVYDSYIGYLSHENDALKDKRLPLRRKLEHLASSGVVSREEMAIINRIISENASKGYDAMFSALGDEFGEEKVHELLLTIREVVPISKEGITDTTLAASQDLYRQLGYYDSITIDEEAKYGNVMLQDGTFNSKHLVKTLDFARSMGKTVRINTLVFYMDCPEEIYRMEEGANATRYAKEKLEYYYVVYKCDVYAEMKEKNKIIR